MISSHLLYVHNNGFPTALLTTGLVNITNFWLESCSQSGSCIEYIYPRMVCLIFEIALYTLVHQPCNHMIAFHTADIAPDFSSSCLVKEHKRINFKPSQEKKANIGAKSNPSIFPVLSSL